MTTRPVPRPVIEWWQNYSRDGGGVEAVWREWTRSTKMNRSRNVTHTFKIFIQDFRYLIQVTDNQL
jgi:hypothetical protein